MSASEHIELDRTHAWADHRIDNTNPPYLVLALCALAAAASSASPHRRSHRIASAPTVTSQPSAAIHDCPSACYRRHALYIPCLLACLLEDDAVDPADDSHSSPLPLHPPFLSTLPSCPLNHLLRPPPTGLQPRPFPSS
ncbi:hypothetical protein EV715DRAFT_296321 [Schizophyllum commune]